MTLKRSGSLATVVLVGRPNVGKSTLFNRITGTRRAIVTPVAGTTRDTNAQPAEWQGVPFSLVDTGGMFGEIDVLHEQVVEHGRKAIASADVVVFVVDGREGLVPGDEEIAAALRSVNAPVLIAVNKTDDRRARGRAVEFYRLGMEPIVEIAAEHGDGVGDLLDEVIARMPHVRRDGVPAPREPETRVAIVGRRAACEHGLAKFARPGDDRSLLIAQPKRRRIEDRRIKRDLADGGCVLVDRRCHLSRHFYGLEELIQRPVESVRLLEIDEVAGAFQFDIGRPWNIGRHLRHHRRRRVLVL